MVKNILIGLAAVATAFAAVPATAQSFTGPRVEVTAGVDDVTAARDTSDVSYGVNAGIDAPLFQSNLRVGAEVSTDNILERNRDIGVSARVGLVVADRAFVYGKAGYANYRNIDVRDRATALDGLRVGGGVEVVVAGPLYAKAEYRYTDFAKGVGKHGGLVGVGFRF